MSLLEGEIAHEFASDVQHCKTLAAIEAANTGGAVASVKSVEVRPSEM
jgi:hypothetical protein